MEILMLKGRSEGDGSQYIPHCINMSKVTAIQFEQGEDKEPDRHYVRYSEGCSETLVTFVGDIKIVDKVGNNYAKALLPDQ